MFWSLLVLCVLVFSFVLAFCSPRLGKREVGLCTSCAFVCLFCPCMFLSFFSSSWCRGLAAVCDSGIPWTFLLIFLPCHSVIDSEWWKFSSLFSQELIGLKLINLVHTWTMGGCILSARIRQLLLLICTFIHFFFLSNFQHLETVRPTKLKLGTHIVSGWLYRVYRNQAAAAYLSLYFFIFLSLLFSNIKIFCHTFSGTMRPTKLKLGVHVDWVDVSGILESGCCSLFVPSFLHFTFSPIFKH